MYCIVVVLNSNEEIIKELLIKKADIFAKDKNGQTVLTLAKLGKNKRFVEILSKYEDELKIETEKVKEKKNIDVVEHGRNMKAEESNIEIQIENEEQILIYFEQEEVELKDKEEKYVEETFVKDSD